MIGYALFGILEFDVEGEGVKWNFYNNISCNLFRHWNHAKIYKKTKKQRRQKHGETKKNIYYFCSNSFFLNHSIQLFEEVSKDLDTFKLYHDNKADNLFKINFLMTGLFFLLKKLNHEKLYELEIIFQILKQQTFQLTYGVPNGAHNTLSLIMYNLLFYFHILNKFFKSFFFSNCIHKIRLNLLITFVVAR